MLLLLIATSSIAICSFLNGRVAKNVDLSAIAGVISGVSSALTAWQAESSAGRKINRYTNAIVALQNHMLWWDGLTAAGMVNTVIMLQNTQ